MQRAGPFDPKPYERKTSFDQFLGWEELPVTKNFVEEYHSVLTKNFLLSYPMPTIAGMKTVLDDLGSKNPKIRELKPDDLIDTRFLRELKESGFVK